MFNLNVKAGERELRNETHVRALEAIVAWIVKDSKGDLERLNRAIEVVTGRMTSQPYAELKGQIDEAARNAFSEKYDKEQAES